MGSGRWDWDGAAAGANARAWGLSLLGPDVGRLAALVCELRAGTVPVTAAKIPCQHKDLQLARGHGSDGARSQLTREILVRRMLS